MKHIKITNYQGIEKADLKLCSGLNIFVGASDVGKSSIVRLLRDALYGAVGSGFVTSGKKTAEVTIDNITWRKGEKTNEYMVGDMVYSKVGRGVVPGEIQQETNIREVEFGEGITKRLNISEQFGLQFLIEDKGSVVAKVVGSLSGISVVFNALREATADLQKAKREASSLEDRLKEAQIKIESFAYLKTVTAFAEKIGKNIEALQKQQELFDNLSQLKSILYVAKKSKASALELVAKHKLLTEISFKKYDELEEQRDRLKNLLAAHTEAIEDVEGWKVDVETAKVLTSINIKSYQELESKATALKELLTKHKVCSGAILAAKEIVKRQRIELTDCIAEYEDVIEEFDLCPLIGKKMPESCKKALKEMS